MRAQNWDTKTANKCQLPKLIPDVCGRCRDYEYCHRQLSMQELMKGDTHDHLHHPDPDR